MAVKPISIRQMEKQTADIYEAVGVMTQRAKQIAQNRAAEKMLSDMEDFEADSMEYEVEEESLEYEEKEKPTTVAIGEFMEGDLNWRFTKKEVDPDFL